MDNLPVNITDIAVIVVVLVSAFLAYARGFVHEVLSVAGWIGAGFITIYTFPYAQPYARDLIPIELAADLAAGVVVFIVSLAILSMLTRAISKRVQDSALNALDRSLGFLFGMLRGSVLVCLVYIAIEWMMPVVDQPSWLRNARTMPLIETGADMLRTLIPEEAAAASNSAAKQTNKLMESQKIIEGLIAPEPKSGEAEALEGYGQKIRTEMERLIDSSSQQ
ncbi:MAG: CvpA family protein [Rhodospirillaceae bacterium]|nr:CvpA family protein [Rhodospirillaceae bacterium]